MAIPVKFGFLVIELNRQCNQFCAHCMRDKSQNISIDFNVIDYLFANDEFEIVSINDLAITGGEPYVAKEEFKHLLQTLLKNNVVITTFSCVTNSLIFDEEIMELLQKLSEKCEVIIQSKIDQFHKEIPLDILQKFQQYDFYSLEKIHLENNEILRLGNAQRNNLGDILATEDYVKTFFDANESNLYIEDCNEGYLDFAGMYVSAKGNYGGMYHGDATWDMVDVICQNSILEESIFKDVVFAINIIGYIKRIPYLERAKTLNVLSLFGEKICEDYKKALEDDTLDIFLANINTKALRNYLIEEKSKNLVREQ